MPASFAALPNLVGKDDLALANALLGSTYGTMMFVGSALGGAFTVAFGRNAAFIFDALSFVVAALLISRIRRPTRVLNSDKEPAARSRMNPLADMKEALSFARHNRTVLALLGSKMGFGIAAGGIIALFGVLARDVFHSADSGTGLLFAARGFGVVVGPFIARRFAKARTERVLLACAISGITYGVAYLLVLASPWLVLGLLLVVVAHLGGGSQWALSSFGLQKATPDHFRGRIGSTDFALVMLTMSISAPLAGVLTELWGVRIVVAGLASVSIAWGMLYLFITRAVRLDITRAESDDVPVTAGIS